MPTKRRSAPQSASGPARIGPQLAGKGWCLKITLYNICSRLRKETRGIRKGGFKIKTSEIKAYTSEQLANAEKLFDTISALSKEEQRTVAMIANAFMEGMQAQKRLDTTRWPEGR